ncbi:hypothetical protein H0H93_016416 [Arthromyces matolae]|nr:hypothetical protein H0H93_016416 [Arthromyces matolae]
MTTNIQVDFDPLPGTRAQVDASGRPERQARPGTQTRASRDMLPMDRVRACLRKATIIEWGKVKRVDSDAGDTMRTVGLGTPTEDARDASFVRYEMFVDINASYPRRPMKFELRTFYGQLEHIFVIEIEDQTARQELRLPPEQSTLIFAAIRTCLLDKDAQLESLDIHFYSKTGQLDVVDITSVQCLVGRIRDKEPRTWAVIDRSGGLARAVAVDEE